MSKADDEAARAKFRTAGVDARFPQQNQTHRCFNAFLDYHRCIQLLGEDYAPCEQFKRLYEIICPNFWVEKWNQQLEEGTFPGRLPNDRKDEC